MNNIIGKYHALRHVKTVDDLANALFPEYGIRCKTYSDAKGLSRKCELVAKDWVRHQYAMQLRPRATVADEELRGNIICVALMFHAIVKSGDLKTLYLVKQDASDFIKATAFTQKLEPDFFIKHFERPLVLYSGEPKTLFDDVLCVELFYNEEEKTLECLLSCINENLPSREFARCIPVEELSGVFSVDTLAQGEMGEGTSFLIMQGIVESVSDLDSKFHDAIQYALKFLLLKESDKQPLLAELQYKKSIRRNDKTKDKYRNINYQRVSLTTAYKNSVHRNQNVDTLVLDKEGKTLRAIMVRGFLRRQHYGPGNSLVKTVYIDSHESHSWKLDGIRIVQVVK